MLENTSSLFSNAYKMPQQCTLKLLEIKLARKYLNLQIFLWGRGKIVKKFTALGPTNLKLSDPGNATNYHMPIQPSWIHGSNAVFDPFPFISPS